MELDERTRLMLMADTLQELADVLWKDATGHGALTCSQAEAISNRAKKLRKDAEKHPGRISLHGRA